MNPNRKILAVIPNLNTGGVQIQLINQLNYLYNKNLNCIDLVILSDQYRLLDELLFSKEKINFIDEPNFLNISGNSILKVLKVSRKLIKILKQGKYDKIIAPLELSQFVSRVSLIQLSKKERPEMIAYHRNVESISSPKNTLPKKLFHMLNKTLAKRIDDKAIFISRAVENDFKENFYVPPINRVIYNSIPKKKVSLIIVSEKLKRVKANSSTYTIIIPGRLRTIHKGQLFFIETFKEFLSENKIEKGEIKVLIAGEGPDKQRIVDTIEKNNLENYFELLGNVENNELLAYFSMVDLVIIPSLFEGLGNVAIEALQQKANLLVSNAGGLDEIVTNNVNGFKFTAGDRDDFLQKLKRIYINQLSIEKKIVYNSYLKRFTLEQQMKNLEEFVLNT